jgi:O-antigen ligase
LIPVLPFLLVPEASWINRAQNLSLWMGLAAAISIVVGVILSVRIFVAGARLQTDVLNPVSIGSAGVSIYIVASTLEKAGNILTKIGRASAMLIGITLCILSASKAPLLEFAAVALVQFCFPGRRVSTFRRARQALILAIALAAVVVVSIWASGSGELALLSRFETLTTDVSTTDRLLMWQSALQQFDNSPLVGDAFVESVLRSYPHNDFLESMMTVGIVGFFLFTFVLLVGSISAIRNLRIPGFRWLGLLFLQVIIGEQTSGSLYFSQIFWSLLLIAIAAATTMIPNTHVATRQVAAG